MLAVAVAVAGVGSSRSRSKSIAGAAASAGAAVTAGKPCAGVILILGLQGQQRAMPETPSTSPGRGNAKNHLPDAIS